LYLPAGPYGVTTQNTNIDKIRDVYILCCKMTGELDNENNWTMKTKA
jgi:hypothetical protein